MGAKNKVVAGDYKGYGICSVFGAVSMSLGFQDNIVLNKSTVESYDLITDEHRKSASSGIIRGAVGATLLGPVGLLAGLSAKNKGIYTLALKFKNGNNSLIEVDDKIYKNLLKSLF